MGKWCGVQEAPLTEVAVGSRASSAILELYKAAPSSLTELIVQTSPHHPIPAIADLAPAIPRPKRKKPLMSRAACSCFRERRSLCSTGLVWSQATSQTALEKVSGRVSPEVYQDGFFSCSAMSEARNWVKWGQWSSSDHLFCSSHYSSHCLKSNCTSAFFAREGINHVGGKFSCWSTVNICQPRSRWLASICTVALQSRLRSPFGLGSHFCLGELILICRYWAHTSNYIFIILHSERSCEALAELNGSKVFDALHLSLQFLCY